MGEKIQQLKSCILDLRNKIEVAEEKIRRATKALGIKQRRCEMLWEDATYKRRKLAIKKEKLKKAYEDLEANHSKLKQVDELLYTNTMVINKLKDLETRNTQKNFSLEVLLKKTRAKANELENKASDLKTQAKHYNREIKTANFIEMRAQRKCSDLESKLVAKKNLLERLRVKRERFYEEEKDRIVQAHALGEKIKESTIRAEAAERRLYLLENKVSNLRQELYKQTGEARKMFVLKNELEHLSLEY